MRHFRSTSAAAAAVLLATALAGCSGTDSNGSDSNTLVVQAISSTIGSIKPIGDKFEAAHPGVKITYSTLTGDSSRGPNISVLSGDGAPDVGMVELSTGVYSALVNNHALVDLDSVYNQDQLYNKISKDTLQYMTGGKDHPYGLLMYQAWGSVMFYNQKMVDDAGVQMPASHQFSSMDEFNQAIGKLKAAGKTPMALGCNSPYSLGHMIDGLLPTSASKSEYQSYINDWRPGSSGGSKYTDPAFGKALQTLEAWRDNGVTEPGCLSQDDNQAMAMFKGSNAAILADGSSYYIPLLYGDDKPAFPVGWVMMPPVNPGTPTPFWSYSGDMLVIPTHSAHKELATQFVQFFGEQENLVTAAQAGAQLPIVSGVTDQQVAAYPDVLKQFISLEKTNGTALIWDSAVPSNIGQKTLVPLLQKLWAKQTSATDIENALQANLQDLQSGKTKVPGL